MGAKDSKQFTIGKAAKYVGVSPDTLRRWEKKGRITPLRSPTNRRYYNEEQLDNLLKKPSHRQKSPSTPISKHQSNSLRLVLYSLAGVLVAALLGVVLIGLLG